MLHTTIQNNLLPLSLTGRTVVYERHGMTNHAFAAGLLDERIRLAEQLAGALSVFCERDVDDTDNRNSMQYLLNEAIGGDVKEVRLKEHYNSNRKQYYSK
jgi:hypothetical protein